MSINADFYRVDPRLTSSLAPRRTNKVRLRRALRGRSSLSAIEICSIGGRKNRVAVTSCALAVLLLASSKPIDASAAQVALTDPESALRAAFPSLQRVEKRNLFLSEKDAQAIENKIGISIGSKLVTVRIAWQNDRLLGYGYIDTHRVRSMTETLFIALSPKNKVVSIQVLAFHEPQEYKVSDRFIRQLYGAGVGKPLKLGHDIAGVAGATLSSFALTRTTAKIVLINELLLITKSHATSSPFRGKE